MNNNIFQSQITGRLYIHGNKEHRCCECILTGTCITTCEPVCL